MNGPVETTSVDEAIVRATQAGLPRVPRPYHAGAESLGVAPEVVIERMRAMMASCSTSSACASVRCRA